MNRYDTTEVLKLLTPSTIEALKRVYGITNKHLGMQLNCTAPNIHYHLKNNSFRDYEKRIILNLFVSLGLEVTELLLINKMINIRKKVKGNESD